MVVCMGRTYVLEHPNVDVQIVEALGERTVQSVSDGRADVVIVAATIQTYKLETLPFRTDRRVLVVPAGHPLVPASDGRCACVRSFAALSIDGQRFVEHLRAGG
jgi:DNA-binding transcriptional LysR family regulator